MGVTPPTPPEPKPKTPEQLAPKLYAAYAEREPTALSTDWEDAGTSMRETFLEIARVAIAELCPPPHAE
jgi:hypothetical protein